MTKTKVTYVVMVSIFALGLWGILGLGARLRPAKNLIGEWQLHWNAQPPGSALPERMTVDQSGRYLTVTLHAPADAKGVQFRGQIRPATQERGSDQVVLRGFDRPWTLSASLNEKDQSLTGQLNAPGPVDLQARRIAPVPPTVHK